LVTFSLVALGLLHIRGSLYRYGVLYLPTHFTTLDYFMGMVHSVNVVFFYYLVRFIWMGFFQRVAH